MLANLKLEEMAQQLQQCSIRRSQVYNEVELFLNIAQEYKVNNTQENAI